VNRRALLLSALFAAAPGLALAGMSGPAPVRLVEPAADTVWRSGESATLAWEPLPGFERWQRVEEWEAFLSVDGGRTYSVRLTPHLDADRRTVQVIVPELASDDARLVLRFGDEVEEREVETAARLRIVRGSKSVAVAIRRRSLAPGEAVRAGAPPTLFWTEGSRDGSRASEREAALPPGSAVGPAARSHTPFPLLLASSRASLALARPATPSAAAGEAAEIGAPGPSNPGLARPILLLSTRRNE
jgi:hypothetical protein